MNKDTFMKRLRELLAGLPQQEAQEAIQYYEDYFADAGKENEAKVIRELGSPEKVAENIRAELDIPIGENGSAPQNMAAGGIAPQNMAGAGTTLQNTAVNVSVPQNMAGGAAYGGTGETPKKKDKTPWIILAACTFYIWIPLLIAAAAVIFSLVIVVMAVGFALGAAGLAVIVSAFVIFASGILKLFVSPAGGFVMLGSGMMAAGLGIFFWIFVGYLFGKWIPAFCKWIGSLIRRVRGKDGEAA